MRITNNTNKEDISDGRPSEPQTIDSAQLCEKINIAIASNDIAFFKEGEGSCLDPNIFTNDEMLNPPSGGFNLTILGEAMMNKRYQLAVFLMEKGGDILLSGRTCTYVETEDESFNYDGYYITDPPRPYYYVVAVTREELEFCIGHGSDVSGSDEIFKVEDSLEETWEYALTQGAIIDIKPVPVSGEETPLVYKNFWPHEDVRPDPVNYTALQWQTIIGGYNSCWLIDHGTDVSIKSAYGFTVHRYIGQFHHLDFYEALLKKGFSFGKWEEMGGKILPPVYYNWLRGSTHIEYILSSVLDAHSEDLRCETCQGEPLLVKIADLHSQDVLSSLYSGDRRNWICALHEKYNINLDIVGPSGVTALEIAIKTGNYSVVTYLVENGADISLVNNLRELVENHPRKRFFPKEIIPLLGSFTKRPNC